MSPRARQTAAAAEPEVIRCAIYTRVSTEEGLGQEFNSLHNQREACEHYIASQRLNGWQVAPGQYDDGGYSGGTLERPALKRLIQDVEASRLDRVIVHRIDRLSRSLVQFLELDSHFSRFGASVVSVTQQFDTTLAGRSRSVR